MNFRPDHVTLPDLVPMTTEKQPLFDPYFGRIDLQEVHLIKSPKLDDILLLDLHGLLIDSSIVIKIFCFY